MVFIRHKELSYLCKRKYFNQKITINGEEKYKYMNHTSTNGIIAPSMMKKVCWALNTNDIGNTFSSGVGLIYDLNTDSVETLCTNDVGSWVLSKDEFIDREFPSNWQLTKVDGQTVFYEEPRNSKLVMPEAFEKECKDRIANDTYTYSEVYLNENAKPIGVFYNEKCQNVEEIEEYAKQNGLPLVNMSKINEYSDMCK